MNEAEMNACRNLYDRSPDGAADYDQFRARFTYDSMNGCWMGQWCGMWVGIEADGYTHT